MILFSELLVIKQRFFKLSAAAIAVQLCFIAPNVYAAVQDTGTVTKDLAIVNNTPCNLERHRWDQSADSSSLWKSEIKPQQATHRRAVRIKPKPFKASEGKTFEANTIKSLLAIEGLRVSP